jgi:phosphopantetheinyl transferase
MGYYTQILKAKIGYWGRAFPTLQHSSFLDCVLMPILLSRHPYPNAIFGIWQITEEEAFFRQDLPFSEQERQEFAPLKGIRRLEWLAVRWLLHQLTGESIRLPLAKDAFSKPFFPDHQHLSCSLSHSNGIVGAFLVGTDAAQPEHKHPMGCDIQVMVEKMGRLAPKFMRAEEHDFVAKQNVVFHADLQHVFWTAKESLYKAYGIKALDFRDHMRLEPFSWDGQQGTTIGWIEKDAYRQAFQLWFEKLELSADQAMIWTICQAL